jgi:2-polyprenyl-3-methyl-5-hydroxy-6-metoxy-1,4-benzoquinol methylase
MDDPTLPAAEHVEALGALATINAVSRTAAHLARAVAAMRPPTADTITVVDMACGGGDVTVALARRLSRSPAGPRPQVMGIDVSPRAIERATELARDRGSAAVFAVRDVLRTGLPPCDVAVSSLFLHHLDDADVVALLGHMATAARVGIVISDLIRSRIGLALAVIGTSVLASSRVARIDGPLSVRAARTIPEYRGLLARAGMAAATVRRTWPERVLIEWRRIPAATGGVTA